MILLASCLVACAPGRLKGAFQAGVIVQPATRIAGLLPRGRERDLPGFQAIHPVPLPRSTTPAEPTTPRLFDGFVDAAPTLPTARASAVNESRGSIARLWHLLLTLQEWCCHHPCKARFRLAGFAFTGRELNPLDRYKGFSSSILLFWTYPGAREVSSRSLPLMPFHSITSSARASIRRWPSALRNIGSGYRISLP